MESSLSKTLSDLYNNKRDRKDLEKFYDTWSATYDKDHDESASDCDHPNILANNVEKFVKDKQAKILDVACGTGRVGRFLKEKGFTNVDGLDGSSGMLEVARSNNLYRNYFQEFITDAPLRSVPNAAYDAVITTGSFVENHLTAKSLKPLGLCVKQGGLMILALRASYLELPAFEDFEPTMTALEREGFWKLQQKLPMDNYLLRTPGVTYVLDKL